MKKLGWIIGIIVFALLIRFIFIFKNPMLWWDSTVYIGMAKYIFSLGQIGLWEYFRPLLWPAILGFGWKLGANTILFGKIMQILFSLAIIFFTFEIAKKIFNIKIAVFSSLLLAVSPIFFQFTNVLYNEIPAIFFGIMSVYLFILFREKGNNILLILSGIFAACAFLTRFPTGLIFGSIFILLLIEFFINLKKKIEWKKITIFTLSFIIITLPYFIFNYIFYNGDFLYPIKGAMQVINEILVTAPEFNTKWYYYFITLPANSFIVVFSIIGLITIIYLLAKKFRTDNKFLLLLLLALPFAYYQTVTFKDLRYVISYLPFLYIISIYGLYRIAKIRTIIPKLLIILILIIAFIASLNACYEIVKYLPEQQEELTDYYNYFNDTHYGDTVLSTTPHILPNSDIKLIPLYAAGARTMDADLEKALSKHIPAYIVFSEKDVPCSDNLCYNKRARTLELIKQKFEQVYYKEYDSNEYYIFKTGLKKSNETQLVLFRMDDVGEPRNFEAMEKINNIFIEHAVPLNWLVIPMRFKNNLTQEQQDYLIDIHTSGWVYIIQHGYWHETELENTEFKGLDYNTQYIQIKEGKQIVEDYFNQEITSFAPPYNSADQNTITALKKLGFENYLTAHWDQIEIQGINRYNSDMAFITDWTPPYPIRSFEELKSDFDSLSNQNIVIIEFHPHRFYKEEDFKTLNQFIEYVKSKDTRFIHLFDIENDS